MPGMDAPLDGYGLCPDSRILASKDAETEPGGRWNAIILLISDDLEQLCRAIAALRRDDAALGHASMPTRQVGSVAKNSNSFARLMRLRIITAPSTSTP